MAGRGFAPKPPERRVGKSKDPIPLRIIHAESSLQPELPEFTPDGEPWPVRTREWWAMWGRSPLMTDATENDWAELQDAAVLHARLWTGNASVASELRLRVAKFGATPEDRARLRITFAQADEAEEKRPAAATARDRRGGGLKALPEAK